MTSSPRVTLLRSFCMALVSGSMATLGIEAANAMGKSTTTSLSTVFKGSLQNRQVAPSTSRSWNVAATSSQTVLSCGGSRRRSRIDVLKMSSVRRWPCFPSSHWQGSGLNMFIKLKQKKSIMIGISFSPKKKSSQSWKLIKVVVGLFK